MYASVVFIAVVVFIFGHFFVDAHTVKLIEQLKECTLPNTECIPRSQCSKGFQDAINNSSNEVLYFLMTTYCGFLNEPLHCCQTNCITPNGDRGLCKTLSECQYFNATAVELNFFASSVKACNQSTQNETDLISSYICCSDKEDTTFRKVASPYDNNVMLRNSTVDTDSDSIRNNNDQDNIKARIVRKEKNLNNEPIGTKI